MALRVRVPKDIKDYHEKLYWGMSTRQLAFFVPAVALAVGLNLLALFVWHISSDLMQWGTIFLVMPLLAFGFIRPKGMTFEQYLKVQWHFQANNKKLIYENRSEVSMNVHTARRKIHEYQDTKGKNDA